MKRVVITGIECITPGGIGIEETWDTLVCGRSGIQTLTRFDTSAFPVKFGGEVKNFDPQKWLSPADVKKYDLSALFVLAAAELAIESSNLDLDREDATRIGVIIGSGIGGINEIEVQHSRLLERGPGRVSPYFIPKLMMNALSGVVSIRYGFQGPNFVTASACASGAHAYGLAFKTIKYGEADIVFTGGGESALTPLGLAGFCALKSLSMRNDQPEKASRPFDLKRDGFVISEGAGVLIFEEHEHAKKRGAKIYAEVFGFGMTGDAHHITAPVPDGSGAARAMELALEEGKIPKESVAYINAHGTSTPLNDVMETRAIKRVFGSQAKKLAISSSKSMLGHLLGASGGVELAITALSVDRGIVHPTANYEYPDPECDLDYIPEGARDLNVEVALSNSFGFGGHNTSIAIGKCRS